MKFKDLKIDEQFTIPVEFSIAPGAVMQKQGEHDAILVNELVFHPDTEVEPVE